MEVVLENIGRRFNKEWIFKNVNLQISAGEHVAVTGANGSGKSTFLQLISGFLIPSEGKIQYHYNTEISTEEIYKYISIASPALELFEDLTLEECIRFHFRLKTLQKSVNEKTLSDLMQLSGNEKKQLKYFSSGMKQRVKIALAVLSDTPLLLLDEPTINLDSNGISWYQQMINNHSQNRTIIVASNKVKDDYFFCNREIIMESYK